MAELKIISASLRAEYHWLEQLLMISDYQNYTFPPFSRVKTALFKEIYFFR